MIIILALIFVLAIFLRNQIIFFTPADIPTINNISLTGTNINGFFKELDWNYLNICIFMFFATYIIIFVFNTYKYKTKNNTANDCIIFCFIFKNFKTRLKGKVRNFLLNPEFTEKHVKIMQRYILTSIACLEIQQALQYHYKNIFGATIKVSLSAKMLKRVIFSLFLAYFWPKQYLFDITMFGIIPGNNFFTGSLGLQFLFDFAYHFNFLGMVYIFSVLLVWQTILHLGLLLFTLNNTRAIVIVILFFILPTGLVIYAFFQYKIFLIIYIFFCIILYSIIMTIFNILKIIHIEVDAIFKEQENNGEFQPAILIKQLKIKNINSERQLFYVTKKILFLVIIIIFLVIFGYVLYKFYKLLN